MFRATANGLHGGPHVSVGREQVPTRRSKLTGLNSAACINLFGATVATVREDDGPDLIAIPLHHGIRVPEFDGFLGEQGGMNSAEDDVRSAVTSHSPNLIAAKRIRGVDANANYVSGSKIGRINPYKSFVHNPWIAERLRCGSSQDIKPTRSNDCRSKRHIAGVYKVNIQALTAYLLLMSLGQSCRTTFKSEL